MPSQKTVTVHYCPNHNELDKCSPQKKRRPFKSPIIHNNNSETSKITSSELQNRTRILEQNICVLKQVQRIQEKDEIGRLENLVSKWKIVAQHVALDALAAINTMSWDWDDERPKTITPAYLLNQLHIPFERVGYNEVTDQFE